MARGSGSSMMKIEESSWCGICFEIKPSNDLQELSCKHAFCTQCLAYCQNGNCPQPNCTNSRTADIVVDETMDEVPMNIAFGGKMPAMLDIEDKFRCEARRGGFLCPGFARVAMQDCRHRICFDCLAQRVQYANQNNEVPNCAHPRCANRLTRSEVMRIAEKFPNMENECKQIITRMPLEHDDTEHKRRGEIMVSCSVWGRAHTLRRLSIPINCLVGDMLNAILQIQRLARNRSTSSFAVYVLRDKQDGHTKYERVNLKENGRKKVEEMAYPEKVHFVVDLDNVLAKRH